MCKTFGLQMTRNWLGADIENRLKQWEWVLEKEKSKVTFIFVSLYYWKRSRYWVTICISLYSERGVTIEIVTPLSELRTSNEVLIGSWAVPGKTKMMSYFRLISTWAKITLNNLMKSLYLCCFFFFCYV